MTQAKAGYSSRKASGSANRILARTVQPPSICKRSRAQFLCTEA